MVINLVEFGAILVAAVTGAIMIMSLLRACGAFGTASHPNAQCHPDEGAVFLFHDNDLVDATPQAWALINNSPRNLTDMDAMLLALEVEFPTLGERLSDVNAVQFQIRSESDRSVFVAIQRVNQQLRVSLMGDETPAYQAATDRLSVAARDKQAALMRSITANSPQLIWQEDSKGHLLWANDAYANLLKRHGQMSLFQLEKDAGDTSGRRVSVKLAGNCRERWFDISTVKHADGYLHFANDATYVVRADKARTEFVKTLGKTFAELSIGIAIFDNNRQLTMFNPALLDMTNLPVDFLSASPTIDTVLDRLREMRMMPEPKNYVTWREQFTAVETAAKKGTYSKNWSLPDGQTYRVTGRPYPDGAFALLFEDISAEVSLTRRFRLDIETGQAVLDTLTDAIAVFSSAGTLVMSNQAYADLWASNTDHILEHRVLQSEMRIWKNQCIPSPIWNNLRDFIQQLGARQPWKDDVLLDDGRQLYCQANPISGGMTMLRFSVARPKRPEFTKLMAADPAIQVMKR
jgi:PAS domain-containing protein